MSKTEIEKMAQQMSTHCSCGGELVWSEKDPLRRRCPICGKIYCHKDRPACKDWIPNDKYLDEMSKKFV